MSQEQGIWPPGSSMEELTSDSRHQLFLSLQSAAGRFYDFKEASPMSTQASSLKSTSHLCLCLSLLHTHPNGPISLGCSVTKSCRTLRPHGLQQARPPCPSPTPGVYSNSCPLSRWCHPAISSSVVPFSSHLKSSQHQGLFQWVSSSHHMAKVLEFQLQHQSFQWIFRTDFL